MAGCQLAVEGAVVIGTQRRGKGLGRRAACLPAAQGVLGFPQGVAFFPVAPLVDSPLGGRSLPRRALGPAPLWAATPPRAALPAAGCPISSQSFSSPKPLSSTQGRAPGTSFILQLSPNPAAMSIPPRQAFLPEHGKQNLPISRPGLHYVK